MPFTAADGSNLSHAAYRKNGVRRPIGYFLADQISIKFYWKL